MWHFANPTILPYCLLPTAHHPKSCAACPPSDPYLPLSVTHCLPPSIASNYCSPPTDLCPLLTAHCLVSRVNHALSTTSCPLPTMCCHHPVSIIYSHHLLPTLYPLPHPLPTLHHLVSIYPLPVSHCRSFAIHYRCSLSTSFYFNLTHHHHLP